MTTFKYFQSRLIDNNHEKKEQNVCQEKGLTYYFLRYVLWTNAYEMEGVTRWIMWLGI